MTHFFELIIMQEIFNHNENLWLFYGLKSFRIKILKFLCLSLRLFLSFPIISKHEQSFTHLRLLVMILVIVLVLVLVLVMCHQQYLLRSSPNNNSTFHPVVVVVQWVHSFLFFFLFLFFASAASAFKHPNTNPPPLPTLHKTV